MGVRISPSSLAEAVGFRTIRLQSHIAAEYANWQSGQIEGLVPVGSTPTSVTFGVVRVQGSGGRFFVRAPSLVNDE